MVNFFISQRKKKGFTLIELIIVIAILAVLAAIIMPQVGVYLEEAKQTTDMLFATNLIKASLIAVAKPENKVPEGGIIEVLWVTVPGSRFSGWLLVREARAISSPKRSSAVATDYVPMWFDTKKIAVDIIELMGLELKLNSFGQVRDYYGLHEVSASNAGKEANFAIHIDTKTGTVALAGVPGVDDDKVNAWIDEIGVNVKRYPD